MSINPNEQKIQNRVDELMKKDMLDDDGYPTEDALEIIRLWSFRDPKGWFDFIKSIWEYVDWGWREKYEDCDIFPDKKVYRYYISTGGWSGNERIVQAMEENIMLWNFNWIQSRRGGHYIFELSRGGHYIYELMGVNNDE